MAAAKVPDADEVLANRVREIREGRGWSQARLAMELNKIGWKTDRTTIAKIENRARRVTVADALTIAVALGCRPLSLFVPLEADARVRIAPKIIERARDARMWFYGRRMQREQDRRTYYNEVSEEEWLRNQSQDISWLLSATQDVVDAAEAGDEVKMGDAIERVNMVLARKDKFIESLREGRG